MAARNGQVPGGRDPFEVDEGNALEALRLGWGVPYDIGVRQDGPAPWRARRREPPRNVLEADTPDGLLREMCHDWGAR